MFSYVVYAEENPARDNLRNRDRNGEEVKDKERKEEADKTAFELRIEQIKEKRESYKEEMGVKKEEMRLKVTEMKANFKEEIKKIKDENKKISAEKIVDTIQALNEKLTNNFSDKINQIENVLVSIESRINKAKEKGIDVSSAETQALKAKDVIAQAREAISVQASKVYEVNITSEATLKAEMKNLRDTFRNDIKAVHEKVKMAHVAVRDTATTLAKIPNIEDDKVSTESSSSVEDDSEKNNN